MVELRKIVIYNGFGALYPDNKQLIETIENPGLFIYLQPLEIQHPLSFIYNQILPTGIL